MRHKRHAPILPKSLDEPFGPPPEEYLYRYPVCSEEMLVNEAIIDVAIGAAKSRGEYIRGMPIISCPGCNGEIMRTSSKNHTDVQDMVANFRGGG